MNTLIIILSTVACVLIGIPSVIVFLNSRRLKALMRKKEEQKIKTDAAMETAHQAESSYIPYQQAMESLQNQKSKNLESDLIIQGMQNRIAIMVSESEFLTVNNEIKKLQEEISESKQKESSLFKQAKPIMERIEAERRRQEEIERKARQKREEEARIARKKREEEEEEERQARRRRDDAAAASSYSSYSSSSSSSDSSSSWSGGGGDSSGGGSSDSW